MWGELHKGTRVFFQMHAPEECTLATSLFLIRQKAKLSLPLSSVSAKRVEQNICSYGYIRNIYPNLQKVIHRLAKFFWGTQKERDVKFYGTKKEYFGSWNNIAQARINSRLQTADMQGLRKGILAFLNRRALFRKIVCRDCQQLLLRKRLFWLGRFHTSSLSRVLKMSQWAFERQ